MAARYDGCRRKSRLVLLALMLAAATASASAETKKCQYQRVGSAPISWRDSQLMIDGTINSQPVPMVVDTGGADTLLPGSLVTRLHLPLAPGMESEGYGSAGKSKIGVARTSEMTIGGVTDHARAMRIDLESRRDTVLVGDDFLFRFDLEINGHEMVFYKPSDCGDTVLSYWDPLAPFAALENMDETGRWPIVEVHINGQRLRALVDTGAPDTIVDLAAARRLGVNPPAGDMKLLTHGGVGTHDMEVFPSQAFDEFEIGGEKASHPHITVADIWGKAREDLGPSSSVRLRNMPDMLLGADFLRAHRVLFSPGQHRMYLSYVGGHLFNAPTLVDRANATAHVPNWGLTATIGGITRQVDIASLLPVGDGMVRFNTRVHLPSDPADQWAVLPTSTIMDCARRRRGSMLPNGTPSFTPVTEPAPDLDEVCRLAGIPTTPGERPDWRSAPDSHVIDAKSLKVRDGLLFFSAGRVGRAGNTWRADLVEVVDCAHRQRSGVAGEHYTLQPIVEGGEQARLAEAACQLAQLPMPPAPKIAPVDFAAAIAPEQAGDDNLSHDIDRGTLAERDGLVHFRYATRLLADGSQAQEDQWIDAVADCRTQRRSDAGDGHVDLKPVAPGTRGALQVARVCAMASQARQH